MNNFEMTSDILGSLQGKEHKRKWRVRWRYAFADIVREVWQFFTGEPVHKVDDDKYERQFITSALTCQHEAMTDQLNAQKIVNGTFARRRLEKWVTRVIVSYLSVVAVFLLFNGIADAVFGKPLFSDAILIAILSTTTINILGMAYIVLKGHFGSADKP